VGVQVTVVPAPVPNITSNEGTSLSKGKSTQLTAHDGVSYLWTPNFRMDNKTSASPIVQPDVTTTYSVKVTNAAGCIANENITIEVINDYQLSAKTLLTPNGDGKNDVWVIDNIDSYPDNEVKVFDQSGREVYRKKRYNNSWDGSYNGAFLPTGTYLYVIYFGDDKGLVKGYLTILK
jgi:gliding motility-associated-like protein